MKSSIPTKPFRVVVGIDFSTSCESALRRAIDIAKLHPGGEVHALSVLEPHPLVETRAELPKQSLVELREMAQRVVDEYGPGLELRHLVTHCLTGSPSEEIVWLAARLDAAMIVVGTHGRTGLRHMILGSVAEKVMRTAGCPVLVDRPTHHPPGIHVPEVEPLCDDCATKRATTQGKELWCERHSEHHVHGHVYSYGEYGSPGGLRPWGFGSA